MESTMNFEHFQKKKKKKKKKKDPCSLSMSEIIDS